jgi:hypothetical protein
MKLISIKRAKGIWEANDGNPGEALWVLSGEYNEEDEPLLTTIDPEDGFPEDVFLFFVSEEIKPNTDYLETFYEVVACFYSYQENEFLLNIENTKGRGGMWELAESLTDEFQELHKDTNWGEELDWHDTLDQFLTEKLQ